MTDHLPLRAQARSTVFPIARRAALAIACTLLFGCADTPPQPVPPIARAQAALELGGDAMTRDDWQRAQSLYQQAVDLSGSVDDTQTHTVAVLNLAWVAQQRGDTAGARSLLQTLSTASLPADLAEQVQLRLVTLALADSDSKSAHSLLAGFHDSETPMLLGLRARLALLDGDHAQAEALAHHLDRDSAPTAERANGLRILAQLDLQAGQNQRAADEAQRCADYDKTLGLSERLIDDLQLHASALSALGQAEAAASETQRAQSIQQAWCRRFSAGWGPKRCANP